MPALEAWTDFNVAMLGATAALAGLVIVAASVNIGKIVVAAQLTARLAAGLAALVLAIVASAVALVPAITPAWYGGLVLVAALAAGVFQGHAARAILANRHPQNRLRALKAGVGFVPVAAYLVAGVLVLVGDPAGLYVAAFGCIAAVIAALLMSWIVLVEILR